MNRFKQWIFFKPLRLSEPHRGIKLRAKPHRTLKKPKIPNTIAYSGLSTNHAITNVTPAVMHGGFKPVTHPRHQTSKLDLPARGSFYPLGRVTPLKIEEKIKHLTKELDYDGKQQ